MKRIGLALAVLAASTVLFARAGHTAGALLVNGAGTPLTWPAGPIPFHPDQGTLGALSNLAAVANVAADFGVWAAVPTAAVTFVNGGALPVDVTAANYTSYLGVCGDARSPIIFDTDGSIVDALLGAGASDDVLGFASPDCSTFAPPVITEASALLNGRWIDGTVAPGNPELSLVDYNAVLIHEFGHYLNLDHSQVNQDEAFDGNPLNDDVVPIMFPKLVNGTLQSTLHLDDRVALSMLYPAPAFASLGTVAGQVLASNGTTPFQGAYVIARASGDPRGTAVGMASGARFFPANPGGPPPLALWGAFTLPGLPPGTYTVEVEPVNPVFAGGSSVGPLDPPVALGGVPERWNGVNEAGTNPPDDPTQAVGVVIGGGTVQNGIDIVLNSAGPAPNDACGAPTVVTSVPFHDAVDTTVATRATSDPFQSCSSGGAAQNSNSVWYRFTPPASGTVRLDSFGSSYDTVATAYTGSCGALSEVTCDDDAGPGLQSELVFQVTGGVSYLIEVTQYGPAAGGTLAFNLDFLGGCGDGSLDAGEGCDAGAANGLDRCCSALCQVVDTDGDAHCDRDDLCPLVSDPLQIDSDDDGLGDACDLCYTVGSAQTEWTKHKLVFSRVNDRLTGNDRLRMRGGFSMGGPDFAIDPQQKGLQLEVRAGTGLPVLQIAIPPGTYTNPGPGWSRNSAGTTFVFRNLNVGGTQGITKVLVRDQGAGALLVVVVGKNANFPLVPADVPLSATVVVGDANAGASAKCGEIAFPGPSPAPTCNVNKDGTRLTCR